MDEYPTYLCVVAVSGKSTTSPVLSFARLSAAFTEVAAAAAAAAAATVRGGSGEWTPAGRAIDCVCSERWWLFDSVARRSAQASDLLQRYTTEYTIVYTTWGPKTETLLVVDFPLLLIHIIVDLY